jgi:steroid 5-alpha reductase family enzyme
MLVAMSALMTVIVVAGAACVFAWTASMVTGDHSWVDRSWSIVPVVYVAIFAGFAHFTDARLDLMVVLVLVWGARLTFNFARKGGYRGVEDYRWQVLRSSMSKWQFQLFNIFFVVLYQNFLLVLITLPALTALDHRATPLRPLDIVLAALFLACTAAEALADQQQWDFQSCKQREIDAGRSPTTRFVQTGLFRYSRHPNFFFEQTQWWIVFLFGAIAARSLLEWSVAGAVLLTLLFVGSTSFTEKITLSKYPEYSQYQRTTSAVVPWFLRRSVGVIVPAETELREPSATWRSENDVAHERSSARYWSCPKD